MSATRVSIYLSDDEKAILDATASRLGMSRSEVFRHLTLYHGLCGGDFPLTSKILALPPTQRDLITAEIRARAESQDPAKPQSFRQWVKDTLGSADQSTLDKGADLLLKKLMEGDSPVRPKSAILLGARSPNSHDPGIDKKLDEVSKSAKMS